MSTSAIPALLGATGASRRYLIVPGAIYAPLSFSRAQVTSRATALAADNVTVQTYAADTPRFHGAARRLLVEGQRSNEIPDPANFSAGGGWTALATGTGSAPVLTANYTGIPAPDGSFTATRLQLNKGAGTGAGDLSGLSCATGTTAARYVWVRTLSGTASVQIGTTALTGGLQSGVDATWRRFGVSDDTATHRIALVGGGSGNSQAADLLVWGASSEAGAAFPSSLILPPVGTPQSATRGADLMNLALTSLGIGGNGACTVLCSGVFPNASIGVVAILLQIDTGNNGTRWCIDSRASDAMLRLINSAGGVSNLSVPTPGVPFRLGFALDGAGRGAASMNGSAAVAQTGGPASGLTMLRVGSSANGGGSIFGEIATLQVLPYALSDAALSAAVAALPA